MVTATFRFYEELNDFLASERRRHEFSMACARAATTKHMIEALGVPHTEVELILVNGASVGFGHLLQDGDRVAVYPRFEALDITPLLRVREWPLRQTRFVANAHLGGLARLLRGATLRRSLKLVAHSPDDEIVPFCRGQRLFEAAAEPKEFLQLTGSHNDGCIFMRAAWVAALAGSLDRHAVSAAGGA